MQLDFEGHEDLKHKLREKLEKFDIMYGRCETYLNWEKIISENKLKIESLYRVIWFLLNLSIYMA